MKFSIAPEEEGGLVDLEKRNSRKPIKTLEQLESEIDGSEHLAVLLKEVLDYSIKYALTVVRYQHIVDRADEGVMDKELQEMEPVRTRIHNATMDSINLFSRELGKEGKDNSWVGNFNGERTAYGKFAILFALDWVRNNQSA